MLGFLNANLLILVWNQLVFASGSILLAIIGGIIGHELAPNPSLATLPVAVMVVGTTVATVPAALFMQRWGRRYGLMLAAGIGALGAFVAQWAVGTGSFWGFSSGVALIGASLGFSQQIRFAAAECVATHQVSYAVSFILLGSIVAAYVAPELLQWSAQANANQPYRWVFGASIGLYVVAAMSLLGLRLESSGAADGQTALPARPLIEIVKQPVVVTAMCAGLVGQSVMIYVMTATPISMNIEHQFSLSVTSEVIRDHVVAMYLPSLLTPWLITRWGMLPVMVSGTLLLAGTLITGWMGHAYLHYWGAMLLLGVGWNLLYVSGTTLLVSGHRDSERYKTQALNEFVIFSASATTSLGAGGVLYLLGWQALLASVVPALLLMSLVLVWFRSSQTLSSGASS